MQANAGLDGDADSTVAAETHVAAGWATAWWARYGLAVAAVAAAFAARAAAAPLTGEWGAFSPFYPALVVAAVYGGFGPGLLATALSAVGAAMLINPDGGLGPRGGHAATGEVVFLIVAMLLLWLCHLLRSTRQRVEVAAAAAAAAERQLRLVTDAAPIFISYIDAAERYQFNNRFYAEAFGLSCDQIAGRPVQEVLGPQDYARIHDHLRSALQGTRQTFERRTELPGRGPRWLKADYIPDVDPSGPVRGVVAVIVDETDRRQALEDARISEERYRTFVAQSTEGIGRIALEDPVSADAPADEQVEAIFTRAYLAECNDAMARGYGFASAAVASGARLGELMPRSDPRNVEYLTAFVRAGHRLTDAETYGVDRDGQPKVFLNTLVGMVEAGRLVGAWGTQRDITDRKLAEDALRRSEGEFRATFELAGSGKAQIDPATCRYLRVNRKLCEMTGYSADELTGRSFAEITHPDDREADLAAYRKAVAENLNEWANDKRYVRKDGRVVWAHVTGAMVRDAAGRPLRTIAVIQDVTERVAHEQALAESEERLRLALDAGRCGAWDWDIIRDHVTWSDRIYEFHGLAAGQFKGTVQEFAGLAHPDDRARVAAAIRQAVEAGEPYHEEFRIIRPNGDVRWISTNGRVLSDAAGRPVRMLGATIDTTDRKQAEDERERLLSAERAARAQAERWAADAEIAKELAETSRQAAEAANRAKDEFLATLSHELRTPLHAILGWAEILRTVPAGADDLAMGLETIGRNARSQAQIIDDLLDMSRIVAGRLRLDVRAVDLADVVRASLATVRPAADARQIRLEAALGQPDAAPSAAPRIAAAARGDDAARTSPAAPNDAAARDDATAQDDVTARDWDPPAIVSGDAGRLQQVVWNLLSNAVKFTPVGGRVRVELTTSVCSNGAGEDAGPCARLVITDTGPGVPPDFLPMLFHRFQQADASTTRRHGGLGLGLSIVKHLVELHGGTVAVQSPPTSGETAVRPGASFVVLLPLRTTTRDHGSLRQEKSLDDEDGRREREQGAGDARPAAGGGGRRESAAHQLLDDRESTADVALSSDDSSGIERAGAGENGEATAETADGAGATAGALAGVRILMAEDDADSRRLVCRGLESHGAVVVAVASADEALSVLENAPAGALPDILLSDIGMPGRDGYDLIARVRALGAERGAIPAAALTAFAGPEDRARALAAGYQAHVPKPVDSASLVAAVVALTHREGRCARDVK